MYLINFLKTYAVLLFHYKWFLWLINCCNIQLQQKLSFKKQWLILRKYLKIFIKKEIVLSNLVNYYSIMAGIFLIVIFNILDYYDMGLIKYIQTLRLFFKSPSVSRDISVNQILQYKRGQISYSEAFSTLQFYHKNLSKVDINLLLSFEIKGP